MNTTSIWRVAMKYAAAKGKAVLTQLSGRDDTNRLSAAFITTPTGLVGGLEKHPERRQQEYGRDRVGKVLEGRDADESAGDLRSVVADEPGPDHQVVEERGGGESNGCPAHADATASRHESRASDHRDDGQEDRVERPVAHERAPRLPTASDAAPTAFMVR